MPVPWSMACLAALTASSRPLYLPNQRQVAESAGWISIAQ